MPIMTTVSTQPIPENVIAPMAQTLQTKWGKTVKNFNLHGENSLEILSGEAI